MLKDLKKLDLKPQLNELSASIKISTDAALAEYYKASCPIQAMFYGTLQWIQSLPQDADLPAKAQQAIQGLYVSDDDPNKVDAEALRAKLLQILEMEE